MGRSLIVESYPPVSFRVVIIFCEECEQPSLNNLNERNSTSSASTTNNIDTNYIIPALPRGKVAGLNSMRSATSKIAFAFLAI